LIAAQLYTVCDRLQDRHQLVEVLGRLREIGYERVEVASLGPDAADHFGEEVTRAGLKGPRIQLPLRRTSCLHSAPIGNAVQDPVAIPIAVQKTSIGPSGCLWPMTGATGIVARDPGATPE
jgi:hypothetical protein